MAPLLIPVATSKTGRVPLLVHPASAPEVNAPYLPPPDITKTCRGVPASGLGASRPEPETDPRRIRIAIPTRCRITNVCPRFCDDLVRRVLEGLLEEHPITTAKVSGMRGDQQGKAGTPASPGS